MEPDNCSWRQTGVIAKRYARSDDTKELTQVAATLVALAAAVSIWLGLVPFALSVPFTVRIFGLMHECGNRSLFHTRQLGQIPWTLPDPIGGRICEFDSR